MVSFIGSLSFILFNLFYTEMILLKDPYLDLVHQYLETTRCIIVPFSLDGIVNFKELTFEFRKANKNHWINEMDPDLDEELVYIKTTINAMGNSELFENFIFHKESGEFLGAIGLNKPDEVSMNIGLWIRADQQGKGYGTEVYSAIVDWTKKHTYYKYLRHVTDMQNEPFGRIALKFGGKLQKKRLEGNKIVFHIPL